LALRGERDIVVAERDAGTRGKPFDGLDEVEMLELAYERDRVATFLAAEAIPDTFLGADRERRRLFGVEGAEAGDAPADALERNVL
jgi:hypothetical protein